jgi:hypothetical protein
MQKLIIIKKIQMVKIPKQFEEKYERNCYKKSIQNILEK